MPRDPISADARGWCAAAVERLSRDRPEAALEAARQAVRYDPDSEWGHRLASLALERLGRDSEAVVSAQEAIRLAPGSWAARLRLASALRRIPGRWREAAAEAAKAVRYAPEEADPHVLAGDLALQRGDHAGAAAAYRTALARARDHPGAHVNLGLTWLRWERVRPHHDPAWEADSRETGRARRALEVWSRQVRTLLAAALAGVVVAALGFGFHRAAPIGGAVVLALVLAVTVRQAGRVHTWPYVPAMLARDVWLAVAVLTALLTVAAYVVALATLPQELGDWDPAWTGAVGLVLLNAPAALVLRLFAETWRGRPVRALDAFAQVTGTAAGRVARRDIAVTLWIVTARISWALLAAAALPALTGTPLAALAVLAVPAALWRSRTTLLEGRSVLAGDRWLGVALAALATAGAWLVVVAVAGAAGGGGSDGAVWSAGDSGDGTSDGAWGAGVWGDGGWGAVARVTWLGTVAALVLAAAAFGGRAARAWWRGGAGPWRAALVPYEGLTGDLTPSAGLSEEVRHAATFSRSVVLAYRDAQGPRTLAVSAVTSVSESGELRLIAGDDAWDAVERDPRVALFVGDPRFWAEVRGVAVPDRDILRITPKRVLIREYPGRHQARAR